MKFVYGFAAADVLWYSVNESGNGIPSLPLLPGISEENTHYMLVSIGVMCISKNVSFRFLNGKKG